MPMDRNADLPVHEIARLGDEIYERDIRPKMEAQDAGKVVAIDIHTGSYVLDEDVLTASRRLHELHADAEIWCVRVGRRALHRIGVGLRPISTRSCQPSTRPSVKPCSKRSVKDSSRAWPPRSQTTTMTSDTASPRAHAWFCGPPSSDTFGEPAT